MTDAQALRHAAQSLLDAIDLDQVDLSYKFHAKAAREKLERLLREMEAAS